MKRCDSSVKLTQEANQALRSRVESVGPATRPHVAARRTSVRKTAALPRSLARLESGCVSNPMRSIAASTLELRSSTISKSSTEPISRTRSTAPTGMKHAIGIASRKARPAGLNCGLEYGGAGRFLYLHARAVALYCEAIVTESLQNCDNGGLGDELLQKFP